MRRLFLTALLTAGLAVPVATPAWAQRGGGGHGGGGFGGGHAMGGGGHAMGGLHGGPMVGPHGGPMVGPHGFGSIVGPSHGGVTPFGHAVPRGSVQPFNNHGYYRPWYGHGRYYWPGYYWPGVGLGFGYYGGYYDPYPYWYDGGYYDAYGYATPYAVPPDVATGGLRLHVEPEAAEVYVDGYYAGLVKDFDGYFHHLNLTPGAHRIEVRAPGYETLTFDTMIQADHTTEFKGRLVPSHDSGQ